MDLTISQTRAFAERGAFSGALLYVDDGAAEAVQTNFGLEGLAGDILVAWRIGQGTFALSSHRICMSCIYATPYPLFILWTH